MPHSADQPALNLAGVEAITFDCYGTLIDWETGILSALGPFLKRWGGAAARLSREQILSRYAAFEREAQAESRGDRFRPYRQILVDVLARFAEEFGGSLESRERFAIADSIRDWPAFDETPAALNALKHRARLAILSNIDDDLFEQTRPKLGVALDEVVTAQQVRSYKPGRAHFDEALRRLRLTAAQVLHVAESRHHDVAPARALGFRTVWVNRAQGRAAAASGGSDATAHLQVPTLTALVSVMAGS